MYDFKVFMVLKIFNVLMKDEIKKKIYNGLNFEKWIRKWIWEFESWDILKNLK